MSVIHREEWRRHGAIIPACFAGNMLVAVHNYSLGAMIHPLEAAFGWARAQISLGQMLPGLAAIVFAPMVGLLIDRFGPRRIALAGVPAYCLALAALGLAGPSVISWWALYFVVVLASLFIFPTVWTTAISGYFDRNRGLAIAVAITGTGVSASIVPMMTTLLIESFGWRLAYVGLATCGFVIVFPLVFFLFDRRSAGVARTPVPIRTDMRDAASGAVLLSTRFLVLASAALLFALVAGTLTTNAVPILLDEGFEAVTAAGIAGLIGIGSIAGRLLGGVLLDRFPANRVAAVTVAMPAASTAILLVTQDSEAAAGAACLILGFAAGAEYDSCAYLASRHFPLKSFGTVFGTISGLLLFGTSVSPVVSNAVYDASGSYDAVLLGILPLIAVGSLLFLSLGDVRRGRA